MLSRQTRSCGSKGSPPRRTEAGTGGGICTAAGGGCGRRARVAEMRTCTSDFSGPVERASAPRFRRRRRQSAQHAPTAQSSAPPPAAAGSEIARTARLESASSPPPSRRGEVGGVG
eukprot:scaffold37594_cov51-Phaeocystis_antarctica.AAC.1